MAVSAAENGLCRENACFSARHVAGTQRRLEGRLEGHLRGRRPARAAGRCRRCPDITPQPETLSGDVRAVAAHGVQQATPWAPTAHAYRSVSRHARRCSSNPPQGAGWDHSAEEAFMATQVPLGLWKGPHPVPDASCRGTGPMGRLDRIPERRTLGNRSMDRLDRMDRRLGPAGPAAPRLCAL